MTSPISPIDRRSFVLSSSAILAFALIPNRFFAQESEAKLATIQDAIDFLISQANIGPRQQTVDTVKSSHADQPLTGIVTTFLPHIDVIREAIDLKANLIVSHEPVFYNHLDETDWLESNSVYQYKRKLLEENGIVVFRYHDYIHTIQPDPMRQSVAQQLGWDDYRDGDNPAIYNLPKRTLGSLVEELMDKTGSKNFRYVGDETMSFERVALMVGAPGGRRQIEFVETYGVEVLVTGEIHEWETSEYVRDANAMGRLTGLVVLGHQPTEEGGMAWLAKWMSERFTDLPIRHVPSGIPFKYAKKTN